MKGDNRSLEYSSHVARACSCQVRPEASQNIHMRFRSFPKCVIFLDWVDIGIMERKMETSLGFWV